jgi:5-methylcytosine-specific restriction endonuclease McrA
VTDHDSPYSRTGGGKAKPKRAGSGSRRRGGRKRGAAAKTHTPRSHAHTSHPTTRNAVVGTRAWLLKEYGPICAYCGQKFPPRKMTLDHVAPRRGQTAYDRRDNLVLACQSCNALKRDQSPLAFLLGLRTRAVNLARYGAHLSEGLLDMAKSLIPAHTLPSSGRANIDYSKWGPVVDDDEDSPYKKG